MMTVEPTKVCTGCGESKSLDNYTRRTRSKDGLNLQCKACKSILNRNAVDRLKGALRFHTLGAEPQPKPRRKGGGSPLTELQVGHLEVIEQRYGPLHFIPHPDDGYARFVVRGRRRPVVYAMDGDGVIVSSYAFPTKADMQEEEEEDE